MKPYQYFLPYFLSFLISEGPEQVVVDNEYQIKDTDTCEILILKSGWSPYDFHINNEDVSNICLLHIA